MIFKRQKGFTLVELLAVLSLISIILVIAVPSITGIGDKMKEKASNDKKDMINKSAYNYVSKNRNYCINNNIANADSEYYECKIKISDLVNAGGYSKDQNSTGSCLVADPATNKCMDNTEITVKISKSSGGAGEGAYEKPNLDTTGSLVDFISSIVGSANKSSNKVIRKASPSGETCEYALAYDGTDDKNLRFVGENPCNYVKFNNELWRIIGVMSYVNQREGVNDYLPAIKIIRDKPIGAYSWDTCEYGQYTGYGQTDCYGVNSWNDADLMHELNEDYLNTAKTSGTTNWYNGKNNQKSGTYSYSNNLNHASQNLLANALWNLGATHVTANQKATDIYLKERGTLNWGNSANTCRGVDPTKYVVKNYSATWRGKIALMYPSDYLFATGGTNRNTCLNNADADYACKNWLSLTDNHQWLLTPSETCFDMGAVAFKDKYDIGGSNQMSTSFLVRPTAYLKYSIRYEKGTGSKNDPIEFNDIA